MSQTLQIDPIEDILADYRQGKMVVLVDDEDRENEGDVLIAADCITDDHINFMATHARGLICLTITESRCQQLDLPLMVSMNNARFSTAFTTSIEAAEGVTTGISAADRATTIRAAVKRNAVPGDIVMPGHIFPIKARPGGVLTRAGHTEAGVDMARLAGFEPASVICEILKPDGTMARLADLLPYAKQHGLKIGTIADLIEYRMKNDPTVSRVEQSKLVTPYGEFTATVYEDEVEGDVHMALSYGDLTSNKTSLVRVHVHRGLFDMVVAPNNQSAWDVNAAMQAIAQSGQGVLALLAYNENKDELVSRMQSQELSNSRTSGDAPEAVSKNGEPNKALRMLGAGGQILADQGVGKLAVLGRERKTYALSGYGLEISEYLPNMASFKQWNKNERN